jgi:beta-lactamase regulating signal transducer with metallopeptidase domain
VISAELVQQLGDRELRGVLAHELAHVRRHDYLGRWLATILRDIMVWNPLVVLWHRRLVAEQEKASDAYAAELLGDPVAVASGLVEVAAWAQGMPTASLEPLTAWRPGSDVRELQERVDMLTGASPTPSRLQPLGTGAVYAVLVTFLVVQPHIAVSFPALHSLLSRSI